MFSKALLVAVVLLQALPSLGAIHERLPNVPRGWSAASSAPSDDTAIVLQIGLVQRNIAHLESRLRDISTPGSSKYGKHLQKEEVDSIFAPSARADKNVQAWLRSAGVQSLSSDGHWITFQTTVEKANKLLNTKFMTYSNNGVSVLRTTEYSIPDHLKRHVDLISPTTYFGKTGGKAPTYTKTKRANRPTKRSLAVNASCSTALTPSCIKQLYNIGNYTPSASSGSKIGYSAFGNQAARYNDLAQFEQTFNIPSQNVTVNTINGGVDQQNTSQCCAGEANLDLQIIVGLSHPLPVTETIVGGTDPSLPGIDRRDGIEPWLPYYQYLLTQPNSLLPQVITDSYGEEEGAVPRAYAIRVCNMAGLLGLRGVSVLTASGDYGTGLSCKSNDGLNTTQFQPIFPTSCPYITSVGGTQGLNPESAWGPQYGTGGGSGGFSNYFTRPWYQDLAVKNYLSNHISTATKRYYDSYVNFKGRAFPDVSARSVSPGYLIVIRGILQSEGTGTSAASPMVGSIIALLNDARLRVGKSSLGFLNPLLYAIGNAGLNDIVSGGSGGCEGRNLADFDFDTMTGPIDPAYGIVPWASWNATVGWDPVTGLGTPDFQRLKTLVLSF